MLLRTRISPIPPSTTFKHQLLGLVSADEAKNLLSSVEPTNRRIALAASWVAEPVKVEPIAEPIVAEAVVKPAPEVVATAGALALISAVEKTEVEVQAAAEAAEQAKEEELVLNVAETLTQRHYAPLQGMRQKLDAMILASVAMAENSRSAVVKIYSLIANQVVKKLTIFYRFNTSAMTYSDHQLAFIEFGNKNY